LGIVLVVGFGEVNYTLLGWTLAGVALLFAGAVALELRERRRRNRRLADGLWRSAEELAAERQLSDTQWDLLVRMLRDCGVTDPHRALTVRREFDACVRAHMDRLERKGERQRFDEEGAELRAAREALGLDFVPFGRRIETTRELHAGEELVVSPPQANDRALRVRVVSVDEAYVYVNPVAASGRPPVREGETVQCSLWRDEDARYRFETRLAHAAPGPEAWALAHVSRLERQQEREHYRVPLDRETTLHVLHASVDGSLENLRARAPIMSLPVRMVNLSAGGFAFVAPQALPRQVLLRVSLHLAEPEPVVAEARILGTTPLSGGRSLVRAAFVAIGDDEREAIARYVMLQQQPPAAATASTAD
jgi:hypothetical protein